jgi:hypothetical protein
LNNCKITIYLNAKIQFMNKYLSLTFVSLFLTIFLFSSNEVCAQKFTKKKKYWQFGGSVNTINYVGELDPGQSMVSPAVRYTKPDVGVHIMRKFHPSMFWRASLNYGRIKGDDNISATTGPNSYRKLRGLNFRNDIIELKGDLIWELFENRGNYTKRSDYNVYGFIGLAFFFHDPYTNYNDTWMRAKPLKTENKTYSNFQGAVPLGLGFKYKLSKQWDLAFEIGWRFTTTDYLDDVSTTYAGPENLNRDTWYIADRTAAQQKLYPELLDYPGNELLIDPAIKSKDGKVDDYYHAAGYGRNGDKRGDKNFDWYIVTGFHLSYIIPERVVCPKFRN